MLKISHISNKNLEFARMVVHHSKLTRESLKCCIEFLCSGDDNLKKKNNNNKQIPDERFFNVRHINYTKAYRYIDRSNWDH